MKSLTNDVIVHQKTADTEYIQYRRLLEYKDIITHAYTLKKENFDFSIHGELEKYKDGVVKSYQRLCKELGTDYTHVIRPGQAHTNEVRVVVKKEMPNDIDICTKQLRAIDGVITDQKGFLLSTINGDCTLLLLFDPQRKVIASVHSGWKGTLGRIVQNTVTKMVAEFGCNPKDFIVAISPSIRKCHFEVHDDVKIPYEQEFLSTGRIHEIIEPIGIVDGKQKYRIDTILANKIMLQELGVKEENILDSGICSVCDGDKVHSRRATGEFFGVGTAVIELK